MCRIQNQIKNRNNIWKRKNTNQEYCFKIYKILIFMSIIKKKHELIKMDVITYYSELMFILLKII